jgi:DNA primase
MGSTSKLSCITALPASMINSLIVHQFVEDNLSNIEIVGDNAYAVCPYCKKGNNHFAVNLNTGKYHCFKCNCKGNFERLSKKVLGWSTKIDDVIEQYSGGISLATLLSIYDKDTTVADLFFNWQEGTISIFDSKLVCQRALEYLATRNITRNYVEELGFRVGVEGKYKHCVVLPVYFQNEVVNLVARQIPPYETKERYNGPHKGEAIMDKGELLYNFDSVIGSDYVVIVEGVFDAIALKAKGIPVVALLGKEISKEQIYLVVENWDKVVVLLDGGFVKDALKIGKCLMGLTGTILIAIIDGEDDPSENVEAAISAIENARSIEYY